VLVSSDLVPTLRAADLFCGAGGLSDGLVQAGFHVVAAADHDPDACATYRLNFADTDLHEGDLTDPAVHQALVADATADGPLDLLVGGPPCQAFSQMRNHDRIIEDPRNRLYKEFVALLDELRPRALLLENVPGMDQLKGGAVRRQIEEDLSLNGEYNVVSGVLDAGDFGTPQCRPRLVFLGLRADVGVPELPQGTGVVEALRLVRRNGSGYRVEEENLLGQALIARLLDPNDASAVTAAQALSDLVVPGDEYASAPKSAFQEFIRRGSDAPQHHTPSRIREDTVRRLEAIPPGGNVYDLPEELLGRYLNGQKWGPAGNGKRLARRHYYAYRRLHPDWLAWTANTKADFAYHYDEPRGLSMREAARIQGFPDRFHFTVAPKGTPGKLYGGDRHSLYRQVGNAVPPPLGMALGVTLVRHLTVAAEAVPALA
jgi:DNA (cytosine-5)-methyltransferase 1